MLAQPVTNAYSSSDVTSNLTADMSARLPTRLPRARSETGVYPPDRAPLPAVPTEPETGRPMSIGRSDLSTGAGRTERLDEDRLYNGSYLKPPPAMLASYIKPPLATVKVATPFR